MPAGSVLEKFLADQYCLIVEPSPAFSATIQACLRELGVAASRVIVSRTFADARRVLEETRPKLLVTEYQIPPHLGLTLIEHHEKIHPELERISILVTRNSSDAVVAEAAEEQVDAFLLKPFSPEAFQQKLVAVLERKLKPSAYMLKIKSGKELLGEKKYAEAIEVFAHAKTLDEKPTLACFYTGETYREQGDIARALNEYKQGRGFQPLHYKCLVAEFESHLTLKNYKEAFDLINLLKDKYPLTPRRLSQIFIATVFARRFDDLGSYYDLFVGLEERSPDLVRVASMALFTAGKFHLEKRDMKKAVEMFEKGVLTTGRELSFLEKVIVELTRVKAVEEAQLFLSKVLPSDMGSGGYNRLAFKVDQLTLTSSQLMERGRKIVMAGEGDPEIFQLVVRIMAQEGKTTLAEAVINRAVQEYPDLRDPLYKILDDAAKEVRA